MFTCEGVGVFFYDTVTNEIYTYCLTLFLHDALPSSTQSVEPQEVVKKLQIVDADGLVVGRAATIIANVLRGKHKTSFTPHVDCGDNVIVINADKVRFTGNKLAGRVYYRHTGYPGGIKGVTAGKMLEIGRAHV